MGVSTLLHTERGHSVHKGRHDNGLILRADRQVLEGKQMGTNRAISYPKAFLQIKLIHWELFVRIQTMAKEIDKCKKILELHLLVRPSTNTPLSESQHNYQIIQSDSAK